MSTRPWTRDQERAVRAQAESWGLDSTHVWSNNAMLAALYTIDELRRMLLQACPACTRFPEKALKRYGPTGFAHVNEDGSLFGDCRLSYDQQNFVVTGYAPRA